jgi:hypothetical protein
MTMENVADELPLAGFREPAEVQPQQLPLPYRKFLNSAAEKAERLHWLAAQLHQLITHAPGASEEFDNLHMQALDAWSDMDEHFRAAHAVAECGGQG